LAEAGEQLGHRRRRLLGELVLANATRLLVLVSTLHAGCSGPGGHGRGLLALVRRVCQRARRILTAALACYPAWMSIRSAVLEGSRDEALPQVPEAVQRRRQFLPRRRCPSD